LLKDEFGASPADSKELFNYPIKQHFDNLRDDCYLLAETHYVDKVFRDSYYHYYSSKHAGYRRDCIRISIFQGEINESDFRSKSTKEKLQDQYRGFIILRPTEPYLIGRSIISPKALKQDKFIICSTKSESTCNGVKLKLEGFPHSSQDTETISCAETTLWSIMEYFGSKYSDYRPALPSKIISTLDRVSYERQIPSKGLNVSQISYALKEFGFGTKIYSREQYGNDFESILSCYVESGIPVITAVDNFRQKGQIGHAIICIGHELVEPDHIDKIGYKNFAAIAANEKIIQTIFSRGITIYDYDELKKKFVFIDDNCPAYQKAELSRPCAHYNNTEWGKCEITYFIVPLYKRIYLEAYEAKNFLMNFLLLGPYPLPGNQEVLIRFFLTSSRSFKDQLTENPSFSIDIKEKLLATPLPKFVWIAELSTRALMKQKKANGVILLDATEANIDMNKPLVFAAYGGHVVEPEKGTGELLQKPIPLAEFLIYENNLINT
jgi:hypothetical protein